MKLSELIKQLQDIEKEQGDIDISVGMSDCMSALLISKLAIDGGITMIEPIKSIAIE
jgi:hypothetical protein